KHLRRWSQGLLFHQALVDCGRAAILIPLGRSIYTCSPVTKCSVVETAFLLLVTVSTVNMLTTVLNDAPLLPEDTGTGTGGGGGESTKQQQIPLLMESPQCVLFGTFMIWFASITINLGPTFLSGALAANIDEENHAPSCPLITGPLRHYVLNVLWIVTNVLVLLLTVYHLYKLYRDLSTSSIEAVRIASLVTTMLNVSHPQNQDPECRSHLQVNSYITRMEKEGVRRVKMFVVVTVCYVVFWGPLFMVTLLTPSGGDTGLGHEVTLHVAYIHAFINPALFLTLHQGLRKAITDIVCCQCCLQERRGRDDGGRMGGVLGSSTHPNTTTTTTTTTIVPPLPPTQYTSEGEISPPSFSTINRSYIFKKVPSSPSSDLTQQQQQQQQQHRLHMNTTNKNRLG
ncbi:hypothetical protein Pmani_028130, partial [Petrolisthes manimaculis]